MQITELVEEALKQRLSDNFGVSVSGVDIGAIEIDRTSDGYQQLMKVTQDVAAATVQAQTAVNIKEMQDKQRIEAENYAETLRIQREEAQYAQRKQTETAHFAAYQVEKQAEVGVAGANAFGNMGANGAGEVSGGFNPAAMMAGMAIGGAMGQNIAGTMNGMMSGMNQAPQTGSVPPPIPTTVYHLAVNGQATGPYDITVMKQMIISGQLTAEMLVWKPGMVSWVEAKNVKDLESMFPTVPPVPPTK